MKGLNETFLQAKTFTKLLRKVLSKTLRRNMCFFGKAFFTKERFIDIRESPVREMVKELKEFGVEVYGYDPLLSQEEIKEFGVKALDFSFSTGFLFSKKKKCVEVYGYDPLLSKEEIEAFKVKALDEFNVVVDCVIMAVAHDEFKNKPFLRKKAFSERTTFLEENFFFLSTGSFFRKKVLNEKPVLIDVRGIFNGEEAKRKGFYYRRL